MPIAVQAPAGSVSEGFDPLLGNNHLLVADDSDATFVSSSLAGAIDRLSFPALPAEATAVNSVSFLWRHSSPTADHTARVVLWLGPDTTEGTTRNLATAVTSQVESTLARPGGGAWSVADVNALDAGYELLGGSAFDGAQVYRLVRLTDYVAPSLATGEPAVVDFPATANREADFGADTSPADFPETGGRVAELPATLPLDIVMGGETAPPVDMEEGA